MIQPLPPKGFAPDWAAAWNSHDLPRILSHYTEDVRFRSEKARLFGGSPEIIGKAALRAYWHAALESQPGLHFRVTQSYRGPGVMVITCLNQNDVRTAETLVFDDGGRITFGAACHA